MKKIFTVLVLAMAMCLAFTGCASKKAKDSKGPKTYRVEIGSVVSTIEISSEVQMINISSLLPEGAKPVAGDKIRVFWSVIADADMGNIYVSCGDNSDEYVFVENVTEDESYYAVKDIPIDLDVAGPVYVYLWSDKPGVCETFYVDEK